MLGFDVSGLVGSSGLVFFFGLGLCLGLWGLSEGKMFKSMNICVAASFLLGRAVFAATASLVLDVLPLSSDYLAKQHQERPLQMDSSLD